MSGADRGPDKPNPGVMTRPDSAGPTCGRAGVGSVPGDSDGNSGPREPGDLRAVAELFAPHREKTSAVLPPQRLTRSTTSGVLSTAERSAVVTTERSRALIEAAVDRVMSADDRDRIPCAFAEWL